MAALPHLHSKLIKIKEKYGYYSYIINRDSFSCIFKSVICSIHNNVQMIIKAYDDDGKLVIKCNSYDEFQDFLHKDDTRRRIDRIMEDRKASEKRMTDIIRESYGHKKQEKIQQKIRREKK